MSLAISAALLTTPILPSFASAQSGDGPAPTSDTGGDGNAGRPAPPKSLLKIGSTGDDVRKIQAALGLIEDGIFGPQTREAVKRFQQHAGLSATGKVDNGTWMAIFSDNVTVLDAGTPEAAAIQSAAGDAPMAEPATTTSTTDSEPSIRDEEPAAAEPALFVQDETPARSTRSDSSDDTGSSKRKRTRSDRSDDSSSGGGGGDRERPEKRKPSRDRETPSNDGDSGGGGECGGALRKPVDGTVTGVFGESRGGGRSHAGVDIAIASGTQIKASTCGRVTTVESQGGYGNIVCIRASSSFTTCYAHMSRFGTSVGKYVRIGEVIGYVGCTGNCTGPHVHFEVRINGSQVDPMPYLNGSKRPGRSMAVRYESDPAEKGKDKGAKKAGKKKTSKPEPKGTAAIVKDQRDANREAGGVPAPPQQPQQAAPPAGGQQAAPPAGDPGAAPAPEQDPAAVDPSVTTEPGAVDDGTGAIDDTTGVVEDTTGSDDGSGSTDDGSGVVEDTTDTAEDTTGTDDSGYTDDGSSDDSGYTDDGSSDDSGYTDDGSSDDSGYTDDGSSDDSGYTDDGSGVVDDTIDDSGVTDDGSSDDSGYTDDGSSDDGSGVVEDTTETVDDTVEDTTGEEPASEDTSGEEPTSEDTSGEDTTTEEPVSEDTTTEEPVSEDTSGDDGSSEEPSVTEDPAGAVEDTVEDTTDAVPVGG